MTSELPLIPTKSVLAESYDPDEHYSLNTGPVDEFGDLSQTLPTIKNIGWTLGNDCPYRCTHCYSMNARQKGMDLNSAMIDRIVDQLAINNVETVNLGGNEPLFTNGPKARDTLLPYIIESLSQAGILVGLTTSGVSILHLKRDHPDAFEMLNDVDVSLDSPFEAEHNKNRNAPIYREALQALKICESANKEHSIIMCAMKWNFDSRSIEALLEIARKTTSNIRINPLKPVDPSHYEQALPADMYYEGFRLLQNQCAPIDLGEPPIASKTGFESAKRCPCGRTSFRIHSITPDGKVYVSPCVYLHDYKAPLDLLTVDLAEIIDSPQFRVFRQRNAHPEHIEGCSKCELLESCGGGCAGRAFLHNLHSTGQRSFQSKDPYCPIEHGADTSFPHIPKITYQKRLVHQDYLCTWIGKPR